MRYILARASRPVLRQFARSRVLLAFDFDGTLAPIVRRPDDAAMRRSTRALFEAVAARYPCVVISGRARSDVARRVTGIDAIDVVGNHGIEPWQPSRLRLASVRRWPTRLSAELEALRGVHVEDKGYSVAVHYRGSPEKKKVREAVRRVASALGGVRLVPGKQVIDLVPPGAPTKGVALERAMARHRCNTAVYVGDDETDEDVFALRQPERLLSIRVGKSTRSLAPYYLRSQAEIDRLLAFFLEGAEPGPPRTAPQA